ncbi:hypothetical protein [Nonlabens ulvanivorans]|uniref:Lipoprotein n=1 Tax=Nonlabens ulvanivorans TaxID=906888 RepID=A0A084JY56_NONUL|nr:hypothetical protein [Nonlabens ulvanivorans]KEZ93890.1 hypothetical protein IL45_06745 [Nonlabens ulvanivorans]PRX14498.1 hypothetical protein LY02_01529 [Nonlabens ulvanivorans]
MKKLFLIAFACVAFISCEKEEVLREKSSDSMMKFDDLDHFMKTVDQVTDLETEEQVIEWITQNNINSLFLSDNHDLLNNSPRFLAAILNKNGNCTINDKLLLINNGSISIKDHDGSVKEIGRINISSSLDQNFPTDLAKSSNHYVMEKEWEQFNRVYYRNGCGNPFPKSLKYRLVHEFKKIETSFAGYNWEIEYSVNFRMSYKSSSWKDANQTERLLSYNLNGLIQITRFEGAVEHSIPVNISGSYDCSNPAKGNRKHVIGTHNVSSSSTSSSGRSTKYSVTGSINHQVNGDNSNVYYHNVNWFK